MSDTVCKVTITDTRKNILFDGVVKSDDLIAVGSKVLNRPPHQLLTLVKLTIFDKDEQGMGDDPPTGATGTLEYTNSGMSRPFTTFIMLTKAEGEEVLATVRGLDAPSDSNAE